MPLSFLFWLFLILYVLFGGYGAFAPEPLSPRWGFAGSLLLFLILLVVGFSLYGSPIQGH